MKEKFEKLMKKVLNKEVILYIVFGVFTTFVNWGVFYVLNTLLKMNDNLANIIAVIVAVLFAYFTNKDWVFHSEAKNFKERLIEFEKFMAGRAFTMVLEIGLDAILFRTAIPKMITKVVITIIVVVLNYFFSKFFAFKRKKN